MSDFAKTIKQNFEEHARVVSYNEEIAQKTAVAVQKIVSCFKNGGKLLICGNGGSAADANHLAAEFINKYMLERRPLPAISLSANQSNITAIGNDYSFDLVFSKQVEALAGKEDILIAISTSGKSKNVLEALKAAKKKSIFTILFTGANKSACSALSDISIHVPSTSTPRVQEYHLVLYHCICGLVENEISK